MTTVLALVASTIFLVRLLPQPVRLARTGIDDGVSALAAINALVNSVGWLVYGLAQELPVVWIVAALSLVPDAWTVALLRRRVGRRDIAVGFGLVGAIVLAAVTGTLAGLLAAGVVLTHGPQVLKALRDRDLRGIAPATWWVAIADATSWGLYGLVIGDPALQGYGAVLLVSAVTVLVRIWWTGQNPVRQNGVVDAPNI
jgi:uncharacterized protein with PQ loop repeat